MNNLQININLKDKINITKKDKEKMYPLIKSYIEAVNNKKQEKNFENFFKDLKVENIDNSYCLDIENDEKLLEFLFKTLYVLKEEIIKKKKLSTKEKTFIVKEILSNFCFKNTLDFDKVLTLFYKNKFKDEEYLEFLFQIYRITGLQNPLINLFLIDYDKDLNFFEKQVFNYENFRKGFRKTITKYKDPELVKIYLNEYKKIDEYEDYDEFFNLPDNILLDKEFIKQLLMKDINAFEKILLEKYYDKYKDLFKNIIKETFTNNIDVDAYNLYYLEKLVKKNPDSKFIKLLLEIKEEEPEIFEKIIKNAPEYFFSIFEILSDKFKDIYNNTEYINILLDKDLGKFISKFFIYNKDRREEICKKVLNKKPELIEILPADCNIFKNKKELMEFLNKNKELLKEKNVDFEIVYELLSPELKKDKDIIIKFLELYPRIINNDKFLVENKDIIINYLSKIECDKLKDYQINIYFLNKKEKSKELEEIIIKLIKIFDKCYKKYKEKYNELFNKLREKYEYAVKNGINCFDEEYEKLGHWEIREKLKQVNDILDELDRSISNLYTVLEIDNKMKKDIVDAIIDKTIITRYIDKIPNKLLYDEEFLFKLMKNKELGVLGNLEEVLKVIVNKNNIDKLLNILNDYVYKKKIMFFDLDNRIDKNEIFRYLNDTNLKNKIRRYLKTNNK